MRTLRRGALIALAIILAISCGVLADDVLVVRNVNLRSDPSSDHPPLRTLLPDDRLDLLEAQPTNSYYHVRTDAGEEGWVWSHNVRVVADTDPGFDAMVDTIHSAVAGSISEVWDKPTPNQTTFHSEGKTCGPAGNGDQTETNTRKNRTDIPASYHDVSFDAIATLAYPVAPKHRTDWTADQLAEIAPFEGVAVRTVGYLVAIRVQTSSTGESCNCNWTHAAQVDWHVALVKKAGVGEEKAVVVETTPRIRKDHAKWTKGRLTPWVDGTEPVRISGWLMLDPEHRNHLGTYRQTLWEIHPITKIEVFKDGDWVDLDDLP